MEPPDLLEGLAAFLHDQGLGTWGPDIDMSAAVWPIFIEVLPQDPDAAIGLFLGASIESDGSLPFDYVDVTVRVRGGLEPAVSRQRAMALFSQLHGQAYTVLPNGLYVGDCYAIAGWPEHRGPDSSGRHVHELELRVDVDYPTVHRPAY